jgi:hypothetical protein
MRAVCILARLRKDHTPCRNRLNRSLFPTLDRFIFTACAIERLPVYSGREPHRSHTKRSSPLCGMDATQLNGGAA